MSGAGLMQRLVAAHNERDTGGLIGGYADGATISMDAWQAPVDLATWVGALDALRESFPDVTLATGPVAHAEGTVITEVRMRGTNSGPLNLGPADRLVLRTEVPQLPPTGLVMDVVGVVVLEHDGQQVTDERHYWPAVEPLVQLGLVSLDEPVEAAR